MIKEDSTKAAAAARHQDSDGALLEQLKLLQQHMADENRQLRELLAARLAAPSVAAEDTSLERWERRRRADGERLTDGLLAGPSQFQVGHPGDPIRLVGAADRDEAVEKYRRHFGILQTNHEFAVQEATSLQTGPA